MGDTAGEIDSTLLVESNDMNDIPVETHLFFDILLVAFILFSLIMNILVSNIYYRNNHIITNQAILILLLTVANLLWTIGILPFSVAASVVTDPNDSSQTQGLWIFQDPVCGIVGFGNAFVPLGKLFTVILMLLERSVAILQEKHYKILLSKPLFGAYIFLAWFLAFLCGILPPAMGYYSTVSPGKGTCFPPLNVYAALVFYILYLASGIVFIVMMAQRRERQIDTEPVVPQPSSQPPPVYTPSVETVGPTTKQHVTTTGKVIVDYERGKFDTLSPASSTGIVVKSPLKRQLLDSDKQFKVRDKDLVDYDLHTGKSKMSKEYNGVLALFTLYAIAYLPFAVTSVLAVPAVLDNISVLLLYSTIWLDPLLLLLTRVMLRRALDRMCFEVCCIELHCCRRKASPI